MKLIKKKSQNCANNHSVQMLISKMLRRAMEVIFRQFFFSAARSLGEPGTTDL